jgi:hypothetical protein
MLASALGRHVRYRALDDLQQRLLHAFARHVARDRRVVALAADLVDLVDVHDAALRPLHVVVGVLQQLHDDVLDVLAHVARFGERGCVGNRERHVQQLGEGLGEQGLAGTGRAQQQDVDVVTGEARVDALVVVVHSHGEDLLGSLLADDVLVEDGLDLGRLGGRRTTRMRLVLLDLLVDDVVAQAYALVTDVDGGPCDEFLYFLLRLSAEGATQVAILTVITASIHVKPQRAKAAAA